jgi:CDP-diacylglycerol--serine O-phosphatidyltransferase
MEEENKQHNLKAVEGAAADPALDEDEGQGQHGGRSAHDRRRSIGQRFREARGVYLLPNLITTGALFAGFFAVVQAMNGKFVNAAIAIFAAMLLDAADGRVARITRSTSAFGAEYDSLSDMVAFGVAPSLVAFTFALSELGQIGWVVTFIYMVCAALRLARFNTQPSDHAAFTGLASPSAAALVVGTVWVWVDLGLGDLSPWREIVMATVTAAAGLLMVSNFKYFSPKELPLRGRVPFITLVLVVLVFSVILVDPPKVLLTGFSLYALSGPVHYLWNLRSGRASSAKSE